MSTTSGLIAELVAWLGLTRGPDGRYEIGCRIWDLGARITPHTVAQPQRLIRQLAEVRSRGYATTSEEMTIGACSIAAPIRAADGHVIAELGVVTGSRHQGLNRLIPAVQLAARSITRTAPSR